MTKPSATELSPRFLRPHEVEALYGLSMKYLAHARARGGAASRPATQVLRSKNDRGTDAGRPSCRGRPGALAIFSGRRSEARTSATAAAQVLGSKPVRRAFVAANRAPRCDAFRFAAPRFEAAHQDARSRR